MKKHIKFLTKFLILLAFIAIGGYIGYQLGGPVYNYILPPWVRIPLQSPPEKAANILGVFPDSSLFLPIGDALYIQSTAGNIYYHTNFLTGWEEMALNEYQSLDRKYYAENNNELPKVPRNLLFLRKPIDIFDVVYERPLSIIWHTYVIYPNGNVAVWIREDNVAWMLFVTPFCIFIGACTGLFAGMKIQKNISRR